MAQDQRRERARRARRIKVRLVRALAAVLVLVVVVVTVTRFETGGGSAAQLPPKLQVATTTRTNVIMIVTDDQRPDTLWAMPHVQSLLVKHGVTFANSFVSDSLCCPSRASILTGNYAHTTKIYDNHPPNGGALEFQKSGDQNSTIATWLKASGYDTGLFGKYLNSYRGGVPPGLGQVGVVRDGRPPCGGRRRIPRGGRVYRLRRLHQCSRRMPRRTGFVRAAEAEDVLDDVLRKRGHKLYRHGTRIEAGVRVLHTVRSSRAVDSPAAIRAAVPASEALPAAQLQRGEHLGQTALDARSAPLRQHPGSADRRRPKSAVPDAAHRRQSGGRDRALTPPDAPPRAQRDPVCDPTTA